MDSRQRVLLALNHQEADHVPLDIGATLLTSIHRTAYQKLRAFLGMPELPIQIMNVCEQVVVIDEDIRQFFGVDARGVEPRDPSTYRLEIKNDLPGHTCFYDEWGIGWKMPLEGGFFYDMFYHPLAQAQSLDDVKTYSFPDPHDAQRYRGLREQARHAAEIERQAVVLAGISSGILELAAWLRGYEKHYADFIDNLPMLEFLLDKALEIKLAYWEKALAEVGEYVDVVEEADDLGGQYRTLISPKMYRTIVKPRHKMLFDFIHRRTKAKIFFHSCGAIRELIPDLIEIGVDILNPVQVNAAGMDSTALKRDFGRDIAFWGGGVDTQGAFGSGKVDVQAVKDDVRRRIDDLAPGGGFVFSAVHNIQENVPPENIIAMWEAWRDYGKY